MSNQMDSFSISWYIARMSYNFDHCSSHLLALEHSANPDPRKQYPPCVESYNSRESVLLHKNELQRGNLVYSGIYPMYVRLGAQDTVDQVLAARDLDSGSVIFAFGQASEEAIQALRKGPWRNKAISTGLFPLRAIQASLESARTDVEQVYIPRGAVSCTAAIKIIHRLDTALDCLQRYAGADDGISGFEASIAELTEWLGKEMKAGIIHSTAVLQLTKTLAEVRELLLYSRIKQLK